MAAPRPRGGFSFASLYGSSVPSPHRASQRRQGLNATHTYVVTVQTGDIQWGGTQSKVWLRLVGDIRASQEVCLGGDIDAGGARERAGTELVEGAPVRGRYLVRGESEGTAEGSFHRGSVREFRFDTYHVGNIVKIAVRLELEEFGESWKLERVVVEDATLKRGWTFRGSWLMRDKGYSVELDPVGGVAVGTRAARRSSLRLSKDIHVCDASEAQTSSQRFHMSRLAFSGMFDGTNDPAKDEISSGIRRVCFQLHGYSKDNCHVYLSGEPSILGAWQPDHALRMQMFTAQDGAWRGVWRLDLEIDNDCNEIKYSYFIVEEGTGHAWWEAGDKVRTLRLSGQQDESSSKVAIGGDTLFVTDKYTVNETPIKPKIIGSTPIRRASSHLSAMRSFDSRSVSELHPRTPIRMMSLDDTDHERPDTSELADLPPQTLVDHIKKLQRSLDVSRKLAVEREREIAKLNAQKRHYRRLSEAFSSPASSHSRADSFLSQDQSDIISISSDMYQVPSPEIEIIEDLDESDIDESQRLEEKVTTPSPLGPDGRKKFVDVPATPGKTTPFGAQISDIKSDLTDLTQTMHGFVREQVSRYADLARGRMNEQKAYKSHLEKLKQDCCAAEERFRAEFMERRQLFNLVQELRGNIRVFCRVRPPKNGSSWSEAKALSPISFLESPSSGIGCRISVNQKIFEYDRVFHPHTSQKAVYEATSGVVQSVLDGYNVCVFAYGQTSSGKTYTMSGPEHDRGVNYRALSDLFKVSSERAEFSSQNITLSMLEIYNENLRDLFLKSSSPQKKLEIRQDASSGSNALHVPGLIEKEVHSIEETWRILEDGLQNRAAGRTNMNEHSSRSHLIISVRVVSQSTNGDKLSGRLHLVDLAGSERLGRSHATGQRMKEAQAINKSLATLGDVFMAILQKSPHVPYRNSKLTYLLRDSLGGDSKTLMFVNISCDAEDESETCSSLCFAKRVARVELGAAGRNRQSGAEIRLAEKEREVEHLLRNNTKIAERENDLKVKLESFQRVLEEREKEIERMKEINRIQTRELERLNEKDSSRGLDLSMSTDLRTPPLRKGRASTGRPPMPSFAASTASARRRAVRFEEPVRARRTVSHTGVLHPKENLQDPVGSSQRHPLPVATRKMQPKSTEKRTLFAFHTKVEADDTTANGRARRGPRPAARQPQRVVSSYGAKYGNFLGQGQPQRPRRVATFTG